MANVKPAGIPSDISLLEFIDYQQLTCLNESSEHSLRSVIASKARNTSAAFLSSDVDEQLLLNIPFNQVVRVRSIVIQSNVPEQAPKRIKLFVNQPSIGFENVEDAEEPTCAQIIDLSMENVKNGKSMPLRYVRFQAVNSLHIFVASNHGGEDTSRIDVLDILGVPVQTTKDLSGLKNTEENP